MTKYKYKYSSVLATLVCAISDYFQQARTKSGSVSLCRNGNCSLQCAHSLLWHIHSVLLSQERAFTNRIQLKEPLFLQYLKKKKIKNEYTYRFFSLSPILSSMVSILFSSGSERQHSSIWTSFLSAFTTIWSYNRFSATAKTLYSLLS